MKNFIERIKSYSKRKDTADMDIRAWKSVNEESYADFCKRMDAIGKGYLSILMDIYRMMRECTTPIQRQISCNIQNDKKMRVNANIYSI